MPLRFARGIILAAIGLAFAPLVAAADPVRAAGVHGVWVWNTADVIGNEAELTRFISALKAMNATDAYLYLAAKDYVAPALAHAVQALSRAGFHTWGLEGSRAYFTDAEGSSELYAAADAVVAYNRRHAGRDGFRGFVSDMEPQDGQGPDFPAHFHDNIADSRLSVSQAADRQALMLDWVLIHRTLGAKMGAAGLRYSAAIPSWTDDYFGEPVHVVLNGIRQDIQLPLMSVINNYIVMCYNTNPVTVVACLRGKVDSAERIAGQAPVIFAALETHAGAGRHVSYADDPMKSTRSAVLMDIKMIRHSFVGHRSFGGLDIHDWVGWSGLQP